MQGVTPSAAGVVLLVLMQPEHWASLCYVRTGAAPLASSPFLWGLQGVIQATMARQIQLGTWFTLLAFRSLIKPIVSAFRFLLELSVCPSKGVTWALYLFYFIIFVSLKFSFFPSVVYYALCNLTVWSVQSSSTLPAAVLLSASDLFKNNNVTVLWWCQGFETLQILPWC